MSTAVCPAPRTPSVPQPQDEDSLRLVRTALAIQPLHLVSLLLCALVFSGWLVAECAALPFLAVVFFTLLGSSAYYLGRLVLHLVPLESSLLRSFPLIFLTGSLSWALLMLGMHSLLPGSLRWHTVILFALSIYGQFVIYRQRAPLREERAAARLSLFVVFFSLLAATCWARGLLHSTRPGEHEIQFLHSMDYFDHTAFTSQFLAHPHLWQYGNCQIANLPTPLYHYGSYLFPTALTAFSQLSVYHVVVAFWTPFGTFLSALAAYVLVLSFGGRTAGLVALLALLVLPDASSYGLHNGVFGYHWRQQMSAGGLYGVACSALALVGLLEGQRSRSRRALAFGFGFGVFTFFFKAQLFVVLLPLLVSWFVLCYPRFSVAWRILLLQGLALLALSSLIVKHKLHMGPAMGPDREFFESYTRFVASEGKPGWLRTLVEKGAPALGRSRYYLVATTLVMVSTLGGLAGVLPTLCLWAWWQKKLHPVDLVPWLVLGVYGLLLVGLNDSTLNVYPWELIHRPFVWVYYVVLLWCAGKACVLLRDTAWGQWALNRKMIAGMGLLLLLLPWNMGRTVQEGKISSRYDSCNLSFPRGLVDCGRYVALNGSRSDLVQDSQYDEYLVFGSLSERRSYLARPTLWKRSQNSVLPAEIARRYQLLEHFKALTTAAELREVAAQTGIRWYLLHPNDRVPWPEEVLAQPAFRSDGFAVYDLSQRSVP